MKRLFLAVFLTVDMLVVILLVRAALLTPIPLPSTGPNKPAIRFASKDPLLNLGDAIRIPTVTVADSTRFTMQPFVEFRELLAERFPLIHEGLVREIVGGYSLLYTWQGSNLAADPILLMAHQDVISVEPGSEEKWDYPPFSGMTAGGYLWGRGSMDDKGSLIAIMEAVESLLLSGFHPDRTIYLAFGHDEETGGANGAAAIASLLKSRGVRLSFVLDEGGTIIKGVVPGISLPVATIGYAEKGGATVKLTAHAAGGHSSMPLNRSAPGQLSRAIVALEENQPAADMTAATEFFRNIAPHMSFSRRIIFANLWLFGPLVRSQFENIPGVNAMMRTTTAVTVLTAGNKSNMLPTTASAVVNFRIRPGENVEDIFNHVRNTIDDPAIDIELIDEAREPSPQSIIGSPMFTRFAQTIIESSTGEIPVIAPYLVLGGTDARHFSGLSDNVYRFLFNHYESNDLQRLHGINERLSVESFLSSIRFYINLIRNLQGG